MKTSTLRKQLLMSLVLALTSEGALAQSASLMVTLPNPESPDAVDRDPHALLDSSLFAVAPPQLKKFQVHDLVQIVVRETSHAKSSHELETAKDFGIDGRISAWPDIRLDELLQLQMRAGRTSGLPAARLDLGKEFSGEGDYTRKDDLTARLTAEVVEILPNGNLILEARTFIKNDEEEMTIKVTGTCRPDDVTGLNTILSNQLHDLRIEKTHKGELKESNEKGLISQVLDALFAF